MMNIFITGRPGSGKTTLVKELCRDLGGRAGGFYTEEVREGGTRTGFRVVTLGGEIGMLASVDIVSRFRVGKYKVDREGFEKVALPAVEGAIAAGRTVIIDEIGPMELFSGRFKAVVLKALDSPSPVIAAIKQKGSNFINTLKSRDDVVVYELTRNNKDEILEKIKRMGSALEM